MAGIVHLRTQQVPSRPDCQQLEVSLLKKLTFLFTLVLSLAAALQAQVTVSFDPTSLSFSAAVGAGPQTRTLTVNGPAGQNVFLHTNGTSWLKINGASSIGVQTPATVTVTADPTGLPAQSTPYTAAIGALATTVTVPVTFSIGAVGVSPSSVPSRTKRTAPFPIRQP